MPTKNSRHAVNGFYSTLFKAQSVAKRAALYERNRKEYENRKLNEVNAKTAAMYKRMVKKNEEKLRRYLKRPINGRLTVIGSTAPLFTGLSEARRAALQARNKEEFEYRKLNEVNAKTAAMYARMAKKNKEALNRFLRKK